MRNLFFICLLFVVCTGSVASQTIARIVIEAGNTDRTNTPVFAFLSGVDLADTLAFALEEDTKKGKQPVDCQLEQTPYGYRLWWLMAGETKAGKKRSYILTKTRKEVAEPRVSTVDMDGSLVFFIGGKHVLQYNHATSYPPQGVDSIYKRSGYIHPLWSPNGMVLTNIQPKDHYHHYGIWNPWTKTNFEGEEIDFWNLNRKLGTVRFESFASVANGDVFAEAKAIQHHVVYPGTEREKTAIREECDIRVWDTGQPSAYVWDFTSILNCASTSPITIEAYRYGGFGFRATDEWISNNCNMTTSEGLTRAEADGTLARWAFVTGKTTEDHCGLLFLSYPSNYNYPEPIRIWDAKANGGRGDYFFNFAPTKTKDWTLEPGNNYLLKYRVVVYSGDMTIERAEQYWQDFANPPKVSVEKKR